MIYLLTLGGPWFAGAMALGALIGFLTFTRAPEAPSRGGWIIALGALALAVGAAISYAEILQGRDAALFDIGYAATLAYAAGLPLGGFVSSLGGNDEKQPALAPILIAPPPVVEPAPVVESETVVIPTEPVALETEQPAVASETVATAATPEAPAAVAARGKKRPGVKPETLEAPRDGTPDDLSRIKGVGPKSLEKLNALGVFHYDQIAGWDLDNARWIGAAIGAPGRVERDKWIQQARALVGAGVEQK